MTPSPSNPSSTNPFVGSNTLPAISPQQGDQQNSQPSNTDSTNATSNSQTTQTSGQSSSKPATANNFDIPDLVKEKYADLIPMILKTESMNDEERQYWFHILPIMTPDQIEKFRGILVNESQQLSKLDEEYQTELKKLTGKPSSFDPEKMQEKKRELNEEESKEESKEKAQEEEILKQLSDI